MKKIVLLVSLVLSLFAKDIVVFNNEYNIMSLDKKVKKLLIGNREMINVSLLSSSKDHGTQLKIFGKKSGNTSILIKYRDGSIENYHVYVNENLGFIQKMINVIEPNVALSKVGDGSTVITGKFDNPHDKSRVYELLAHAGVDMKKFMDLTDTQKVNKMIRTKLYLVEVNNQRAKDLGGVTGLSFFSDYLNVSINPNATSSATFSGWLLNNAGGLSQKKGTSITSTLNFLEQEGIGKILDDTVLITTEDKNASFRVGGKVYIPTGLTQNAGFAPTIQLEEKEYGLYLNLTSKFMQKDGFMYINISIEDSEFDTNKDHNVNLGENISVPSFLNKKIETNVVVESGQVIALGGRLHTEDIDKEEKIPFLGDIPYLGELFTHTISGVKANDLLFFLVPEIVDANEEVNDTHFYRDFKNEATLFHEESVDITSDKLVDVEQPMVVEETTTKEVPVKVTNVDDQVMVIETEDDAENNAEDNIDSVHDEVIAEEEPVVEVKKTEKPATIEKKEKTQTITEVQKPLYVDKRKEKVITIVAKKPQAEEKSSEEPKVIKEDKEDETAKKQLYSVNIEKIFLRDKPVDGEPLNVWIKGHEFTSTEEKDVNGTLWLKIDENCYKGCEKENRDLWISKNFVNKI